MPEAEVTEAQAKLDELIASGVTAFNEGRTEEARAIAESAVAANPSLPAAFALKGMCHERVGEIAEALECYEHVVSLNPDSAIDKIKLNQLRNSLAANLIQRDQPDRKRAFIGALAATILVASVGALFAVVNQNARTAEAARLSASNAQANQTPMTDTGMGSQNPLGTGTNPGMVPSNPAAAGPAPGNPVTPNPTTNSNASPSVPPTLPPSFGTGLPQVREQGDVSLQPVNPVITGPIGDASKPPRPNGNGNNNPPRTKDPDPEDGTNATAVVEPDPGVIEINVRSNRLAGGGSDVEPSPTGLRAFVETANSRMLTGDYNGAADSFQRALNAGGDRGTLNQKLGQALDRAGRAAEAITAYQRAAEAFEANIKAGRGDRARNQAALDSCRQALRVLQGG